MAVQLVRRRFTVKEYYQMAEAGILHADDRIELLEGQIVEMAPIGSRHAACVARLNSIFFQKLGERAIVRVQGPIHLGEVSEPQPDLSLLRPRPDFYATAHPGPEDVLWGGVADVRGLRPGDKDAPLCPIWHHRSLAG